MGLLQALHPVQLINIIVGAPFAVGLVGLAGLLSGRFELWRDARFNRLLTYLSVGAAAVSLLLSVNLALRPAGSQTAGAFSFLGYFRINLLFDALSVYFVLLVNAIAFAASWNAVNFLKGGSLVPPDGDRPQRRRSPAFFNTLVNFFHVTMLAVSLVDNLISLWIAIEATTLVSTLLVSFRSTPAPEDKSLAPGLKGEERKRWEAAWKERFIQWDKNSWEAAWKYLIITSTGIIFALLGTMFIAHAADGLSGEAAATGDPNGLLNWTFLVSHAGKLTDDFVKLSFLFVLVGYGTKAGLAPMHTWLPDGHGEAPPPISALLSGVLLKSALYAILRFYTITNAALGNRAFTSALLLGAGLFSLVLATPFILKRENSFKRVLAYHSLEHMGIITFGIGVGGPVALFGALLHTLNHAVTKALMFLSYGNIARDYERNALESGQMPRQVGVVGALRSMPLTSVILSLGGLALVGSPLFNIFLSETVILWGALTAHAPAVAVCVPGAAPHPAELGGVPWPFIAAGVVLFVVSTTLIFYGLVRHLAARVLGEGPGRSKSGERPSDLFPLFFLLAFVCALGLFVPAPLSDLLARSVQVVLGCRQVEP